MMCGLYKFYEHTLIIIDSTDIELFRITNSIIVCNFIIIINVLVSEWK